MKTHHTERGWAGGIIKRHLLLLLVVGACGSKVALVSSGLSQSTQRGRCRVKRITLTNAISQI